MRVTVSQISDLTPEPEWAALADHCAEHSSELVVLGEMPFAPWLAGTDDADPEAWRQAVEAHDVWIERLRSVGIEEHEIQNRVAENLSVPYSLDEASGAAWMKAVR